MALYAALIYQPASEYWTGQPGSRSVRQPGDAEFMAEASAAAYPGRRRLFPPGDGDDRHGRRRPGRRRHQHRRPYAEAKEVLGGFFLIEAADLDEATRWAGKIPATWDGGKVELRPVVPMNQ